MQQGQAMKQDVEKALNASSVFSGVSATALQGLIARSRIVPVPAGGLAFTRSQEPESCWFVLDGLLKLSLASPSGREMTVALGGPGDLLGCLAGICSDTYLLAGTAVVDSRLLEIPHKVYAELLAGQQRLAANVMQLLGFRLKEALELRALAVEPAKARLLWVLLWLIQKLGSRLPLTRTTLAEIAGVAPETCIRMLSPLEKTGVIHTVDGTIVIKQPRRLQAMLPELRPSHGGRSRP